MREEAVQVLRTIMRSLQDTGREVLRWLVRTPGQTFVLCPIAVIAVELALHHGTLIFVPWGCLLLVWGYLQYQLVGRYRLPRAGGSWGMEVSPDQIVATGPYRYTRNPMYLGHLIFMLGVSLTFWSWFALILLATRAVWFHCRVLSDEQRLETQFGTHYAVYRRQVKRWIPGIL
jgi:protein-S-isoprenylcysteine O-methyltransferase Ste14